MTTALSVVYASAPTNERIIPAIRIQLVGHDPIYICADYEDHVMGVDGNMVTFQRASLSVALPAKNTTGQQTLVFGIPDTEGDVQRYVDDALEAGQPVELTYYEYLESDLSAPAKRPRTMTIVGGDFQDAQVQLQASYYDMLNASWPRERYTAETAPGIKYLS